MEWFATLNRGSTAKMCTTVPCARWMFFSKFIVSIGRIVHMKYATAAMVCNAEFFIRPIMRYVMRNSVLSEGELYVVRNGLPTIYSI